MAALMQGADKLCCQGLKNTLEQNYLIGMNNYPKTMDDVENILNTYSQTAKPITLRCLPKTVCFFKYYQSDLLLDDIIR